MGLQGGEWVVIKGIVFARILTRLTQGPRLECSDVSLKFGVQGFKGSGLDGIRFGASDT